MKWKTKYTCFHFIAVQPVRYILFFILWHFERYGIFSFTFYNGSNGVVYFVFHFMTVRTGWYIFIKCKTKYTAPFNCHIMKIKIYHTVRTVIKWKQNIPHRSNCHNTLWQFERFGIFSFSFYNCSNGVVYIIFIL
jgi:hypothetical protein